MKTLDEYLRQSGVKNYELAEKTGIHKVSISRLRNGGWPSHEYALAIYKATNGEVVFIPQERL
jgi:transcriptional regulator with XRE-family HTH domain